MKRIFPLLLLLVLAAVLMGCGSNRALPYRIADREEAVKLYLSNESYFARLTQNDVQFRTQDKNGTVDTLKSFGAAQMLDFSEEEKELLREAMDEIEELLREKNIRLPAVGEIVFIKSTQKEEGGRDVYSPSAYTHGTQIYLNNYVLLLLSTGTKNHARGVAVLVHELFHCLSRSDPAFREEMYGLLGFRIADGDYTLPAAIADKLISNPDVEHHDATAEFTIRGEKKECYLATVSTRPFEQPGELLGSYLEIVLVSVDGDGIYFPKDAEDFRDVMGSNTDYVIDPEECLAENFSFALTYGENNPKAPYKTPELIRAILEAVTEEANRP